MTDGPNENQRDWQARVTYANVVLTVTSLRKDAKAAKDAYDGVMGKLQRAEQSEASLRARLRQGGAS